MKKNKLSSLALTFILLLTAFTTPISAATTESGAYDAKDEVIYGKLSPAGAVDKMYVVNSFHITKEGYITDYGKYTDVRNLTNLDEIEASQDRNTFLASGENFYYQGQLDTKQLPWDISISYLLDGEPIEAKDLAGQSGQLEIHIQTEENEQIDEVFFENYLLQIMLTFDPLVFEDIQAPKGTEANEGKNKLITFSVMPGQEETVIASAEVSNLRLDPIEISAVPANLAFDDLDTDDMREDIETLSDAIAEIHKGVGELKDGTSELNDGAKEVKEGSGEFLAGMQAIKDSSSDLRGGSKQILDALKIIDSNLEVMPDIPDFDMEELERLPDLLREIAHELEEFTKSLDDLIDAINDIDDIEIPEEELEKIIDALREAGISEGTIEQLIAMYDLAKDIAESIGEYPEELKDFLLEMAKNLRESADEFEENLELLEQIEELEQLGDGLKDLRRNYENFHSGLLSYTDGVSSLATEYTQLNDGIGSLASGTEELRDGVSELHKGTGELHEETKDLSDELKSEIERMLEDFDFSDFKATSFISEKNKKIGVVQFVLRTETIEVTDDEEDQEEEEEKKSLWQRFLDLFRWK